MGFFNKIFGGADGCRESMRDAYIKHTNLANQNKMDSPHEMGLYGALTGRYKSIGLPAEEVMIWPELAPFIAMEKYIAIEALAEYVVFQENSLDAHQFWLSTHINNALCTTSDKSLLKLAELGILNNVTWSRWLYPNTTSNIILGKCAHTKKSISSKLINTNSTCDELTFSQWKKSLMIPLSTKHNSHEYGKCLAYGTSYRPSSKHRYHKM
jgi:hypothetical protein